MKISFLEWCRQDIRQVPDQWGGQENREKMDYGTAEKKLNTKKNNREKLYFSLCAL